jgi:hypothetical protein
MASSVHTKENLEFITVAAEFCLFLEQLSKSDKLQFVNRAVKYLPLLYLKTTLIPFDNEDYESEPERMVSETDYELIRESVASLLGMADNYLEVFHPDMQYSDTPIAASISENMADIYQEIKDFLFNCQIGNDEAMQNALTYCLSAFRNHWGQKLLNALRALHQICYGETNDEEANIPENQMSNHRRLSVLQYQQGNDPTNVNL